MTDDPTKARMLDTLALVRAWTEAEPDTTIVGDVVSAMDADELQLLCFELIGLCANEFMRNARALKVTPAAYHDQYARRIQNG